MKRRAIVLHPEDNVASALADLSAGEMVTVEIPESAEQAIKLVGEIPLGHKFALRDIPVEAEVIKHGVPIGWASQRIGVGEHVHVHNVRG